MVDLSDPKHPKYRSDYNNYSTPSQSDLGLSDSFSSRYQSALNAYNPESIKDSPFDILANFFGFRSSADKLRDQLNQSRQEQLNQLVNQQAEQEYNSESAKADRMRAAGLNPDLQGIGDASEATEGTEPQTSPDFSQLTSFKDFVSGFGSAFQSALSIMSGVQSFRMTGIDISSKLSDLNDKLQGKSLDIIRNTLSEDELKEFFEGASDPDNVNVFGWSDSTLSKYGLRSKRDREFFRKYAADLQSSYQGQISKYKSYSDFLDAQEKTLKTMSSWYREKDNPFVVSYDALKEWNNTLHTLETLITKYQSDYNLGRDGAKAALVENKELGFQSDYYDAASGRKAGLAFSASKELEKYIAEEKHKLIMRLLSKRNPFNTILVTQMLTGVNPLNPITDVIGGVSKLF